MRLYLSDGLNPGQVKTVQVRTPVLDFRPVGLEFENKAHLRQIAVLGTGAGRAQYDDAVLLRIFVQFRNDARQRLAFTAFLFDEDDVLWTEKRAQERFKYSAERKKLKKPPRTPGWIPTDEDDATTTDKGEQKNMAKVTSFGDAEDLTEEQMERVLDMGKSVAVANKLFGAEKPTVDMVCAVYDRVFDIDDDGDGDED